MIRAQQPIQGGAEAGCLMCLAVFKTWQFYDPKMAYRIRIRLYPSRCVDLLFSSRPELSGSTRVQLYAPPGKGAGALLLSADSC